MVARAGMLPPMERLKSVELSEKRNMELRTASIRAKVGRYYRFRLHFFRHSSANQVPKNCAPRDTAQIRGGGARTLANMYSPLAR